MLNVLPVRVRERFRANGTCMHVGDASLFTISRESANERICWLRSDVVRKALDDAQIVCADANREGRLYLLLLIDSYWITLLLDSRRGSAVTDALATHRTTAFRAAVGYGMARHVVTLRYSTRCGLLSVQAF